LAKDAVQIRRADERDASALAELHLRTALYAFAHIFPADAPPPELARLTDDWGSRIKAESSAQQVCFVAETEVRAVGVVVAGSDPSQPIRGHLSRLYVDPVWWGRGIGRMLYECGIDHLRHRGFRSATLWVLEGNVRARGWYERLG
jgi:ribosomal protein S18 acetylase RimI-like enzyme